MSTTQPIKDEAQLKLFKQYYRQVKVQPRNYLLLVVGLNTALRISDILQLKYGDVYDYEMQCWKKHLVVKEQKTGKINTIFINREIKDTLEMYADYLAHTASDWLFESQMSDEKPLGRHQAFRIVKEAAAYAKLGKHISCHSLRKTFGYHAWKRGTPPAVLMNIYNHSSFQVTKRYLCIDQDDRDAVFEHICL